MNKNLLKDIPTPAYIYDEDKFKENVSSLISSFRKEYGKYHLGYSFKTNYVPDVCDYIRSIGEYAEVVSPYELQLALKYGFDYSHIIYNGVIKDNAGKINVAMRGGIVNIDNLSELYSIEKDCEELGISIDVGIRMNFNVGNNLVSRFGVEYKSDDYYTLKNFRSDHVRIVGVHYHMYGARELKYWAKRAETMIAISDELCACRWIDLGGNMYGSMVPELAIQYGEDIPTYQDYAREVGTIFMEHYGEIGPTLITENGTPIVSDAFYLLGTAMSEKNIRGKRIVNVDCSIYNIGFLGDAGRIIPVEVLDSKGESTITDIHGYACTECDVIRERYRGALNVGDKVLFKNVGSYTIVRCSPFICECPPVYKISNTSEISKIAET